MPLIYIIDTVAGTGAAGDTGDGGPSTAATLYAPAGVALDALGTLYIADTANSVARQVGGLGSPRRGATGTVPWHAHHSMSLGGALALSVDLSDGHLDASSSDLVISGRGPDLAVRHTFDSNGARAGSATGAGAGADWLTDLTSFIGGVLTRTVTYTDANHG